MAHLKYLLLLPLVGCGSFEVDDSQVEVTNRCHVTTGKLSAIAVEDGSKAIEKVVVDSNCNVEVIFEQDIERD